MQIFSHVALSPHVSCYFRLCAGHYSHKIIHRNNSYAVIYLQTCGLFPSARRLRALAICDHPPAFRGRARLRPSCSGSFLHPSRTPVSFQPNASHPHRTPLSCLSLDSNPQLRWSGGGLSESLPSLSADPYGMSKHLRGKSSSRRARPHLPWTPVRPSIFSCPISPGRGCFTCFSWADCSEEGLWQE